MQTLHDFRLFYNQSIHPELVNLERRRRRLLRLFVVTVLLLLTSFVLAFWFDELLFNLLLVIPIAGYGFWLFGQVDIYRKEFKPRIIGLLLDFIDNDINYGTLNYRESPGIGPEIFFESCLFACNPVEYVAEDHISGLIREMPFELCELDVREFSNSRATLDQVFRGVFLTGEYNFPMRGKILMLPDHQRQFSTRTAKQFSLLGGQRRYNNLLPEFEEIWDTYATPDANLPKTLSPDMQLALLNYRQKTGKDVFVSIIENRLFVAVTQPKDLLEAVLFRNVISFDLVREYFEDLHLLISIVEDVDALN